MVIFDENIEEFWIKLAKEISLEFISIRDSYSGISDIEVIELASKFNALIVTEDKDFGELVFSYGYKCSVLLIRYDKPNYLQISFSFKNIISNYDRGDVEFYRFIVLTKNSLRVRKFK